MLNSSRRAPGDRDQPRLGNLVGYLGSCGPRRRTAPPRGFCRFCRGLARLILAHSGTRSRTGGAVAGDGAGDIYPPGVFLGNRPPELRRGGGVPEAGLQSPWFLKERGRFPSHRPALILTADLPAECREEARLTVGSVSSHRLGGSFPSASNNPGQTSVGLAR